MSVMPTVTLEVAFTTDPGATPTWTDISAYLMSFTINRGRQRELDRYAAGRASILLDNTDRRFDPNYSSSPYYPNVVPMRRVRIRATYNAVTYDVFNGYADGWRQTYAPPGQAFCELSVTDAFKVLAGITLAGSVWEREIRADNPAVWWRLDESAGSTSLVDAISGRVATTTGTPTLGATGLVSHDPGTAMQFPTRADGAWSPPTGAVMVSALPVTVAYIVNTTDAAAGAVVRCQDAGGIPVFEMSIASPNPFITVRNSAGTSVSIVGSANVIDGNPHLIVGVWDGSNNVTLYVDGAVSAGPTAAAGTINPITHVTMGGGMPTYFGGTTTGTIATLDEVAVFPTAVSAARISAWASARSAPWSGDLSGARIGHLLDAAGWPTADRNIDTGMAVLQSADLGTVALDGLQTVEETEQGRLFVTAAGLVRFIARDSILKAPYITSQGTFGDSGAELEYGDLEYEYDDQLIYNEAQVSRSGGTVQVVADATSQTRYLRRVRTLDGLLHQSDLTSRDLANWIVTHYKDPLLRVTGLTLEPSAGNDTTHYPHVLGRELGDRVTVKRVPQNLGTAINQDAVIEGITHRVSAQQWVTTWNLSPAETQIYWILGTAGFSELDQTTRVGF